MGAKANSKLNIDQLVDSLPNEIAQDHLIPSDADEKNRLSAAEILSYFTRRETTNSFDDQVIKSKQLSEPVLTELRNTAARGSVKTNGFTNVNFEQLAESIRFSTVALRELKRHNETMSSEAVKTISSLREDLSQERGRNADLAKQFDAIRAENERLKNESVKRMKEFEANITALSDKLEKTTHELSITREWLDYLNNQINAELLTAANDAEKIISSKRKSFEALAER